MKKISLILVCLASLKGIGARLQKKPEGAKVVEIISGGQFGERKSLEVGDEIIKVGQAGEEPIDIAGMRMMTLLN